MQIVIDIDEETYADIKKGKVYSSYRDVPQESVLAIANGTLLPKGHGRLIDADAIVMPILETEDDEKWVRIAINSAQTIIEADTGSEDKE